jgi:acetate kinase
MPDALLVLNAGSSSVKFAVFLDDEPPQPLLRGQIEGLLTHPRLTARDQTRVVDSHEWPAGTRLSHQDAIEFLLTWGRRGVLAGHRIVAVGHRVVHGGVYFTGPVLVDAATMGVLQALVPLAPLHQPHNLAAIEAVARMSPGLPQVACFDTAFHRSLPEVAQMFAVPRRYSEEGVKRYGFHGLSYEYIAGQLPWTDTRAAEGRTVVAHLGNGASLCAMRNCASVATTMGFTALDGLVMGTRCGAIDPGVLLYLIDRHELTPMALKELLYEQSGLLGVSEFSGDMRTLLASADARAVEAVNLFVYRVTRELGSLAAALGGLEAVVFTGGIGENAAAIRALVCRDASWLGLELDDAANERGGPRISRRGSRVSAWVIPTNEELMIALHTRNVLGLDIVSTTRSMTDEYH